MSTQISGSLTATGSVTLPKKPHETTVAAQISGDYTTTSFVFEGSIDGTHFFPLVAGGMSDGILVSGTISPADASTVCWIVRAEHCSFVRLRCTAIATLTLNVALESGSFMGPFLSVAQTGFTIGGAVTATGITCSGAVSGGALTVTSIVATGNVACTGNITMTDTKNIIVSGTTGTKFGTGATQKIGFWNANPVVQPAATGATTSGFTAVDTATVVAAASTFTGATGAAAYTITDIVKNLKNAGLLAA